MGKESLLGIGLVDKPAADGSSRVGPEAAAFCSGTAGPEAEEDATGISRSGLGVICRESELFAAGDDDISPVPFSFCEAAGRSMKVFWDPTATEAAD